MDALWGNNSNIAWIGWIYPEERGRTCITNEWGTSYVCVHKAYL